MTTLVEIGFTHNFINCIVAARAGIALGKRDGVPVIVANDDTMAYRGFAPNVYETRILRKTHVPVSDTVSDTDTPRILPDTYPTRITDLCELKILINIWILVGYLRDTWRIPHHQGWTYIHWSEGTCPYSNCTNYELS